MNMAQLKAAKRPSLQQVVKVNYVSYIQVFYSLDIGLPDAGSGEAQGCTETHNESCILCPNGKAPIVKTCKGSNKTGQCCYCNVVNHVDIHIGSAN